MYSLSEVIATTSPSMDIQVSSNFERFLFEAAGRDAAVMRGKMNGLRQSGSIGLGEAIVPYREAFIAERIDQDAVADCIRRVRARVATCSIPTALARSLRRARRSRSRPGTSPTSRLPPRIPPSSPTPSKPSPANALPCRRGSRSLMSAKERVTVLPNDLAAVQRFVEKCARNRQGAAA